MTTTTTITFYDIHANVDPVPTMSPSTLRVRYALNLKGIAFKTVWVEFPDIEQVCKGLGVAPTGKSRDGKPRYTLPAIKDVSTGIALSDGAEIIEYLDKAYPNTPTLLPRDTIALQLATYSALVPRFLAIYPLYAARAVRLFNPGTQRWWRETRAVLFGKSLEEAEPRGEEKTKALNKFIADFGEVYQWMSRGDGSFSTGDRTVSFVELTLAGMLNSLKIVFGEDSEEWQKIASWNNASWLPFLAKYEQYHKAAG
ncbi:hypothetical protein PC9H_010738 [Pleurotus ostreatus]|uniref:GST N-terminal domain-containing protein n=2 Tax=Pleurotus TaxID=5320 RepID=A0A8H6ZKA8_PLEOS|nr:uncharacterized protein PC9H_010738 [Pleurotus ostreatus]KAF7422582.1 hypothetical protein PC9H_010738 [Pleurotus ostreatus]KAG9227557.1 hypothetical protein CCMSSC00406_0000797 [Pleurotus cornucopiae]KAJ8691549.1 hypothetical protein PTI98_011111 [Pleurotus ostreatus]